MNYHYRISIQWSEEDNKFIAHLPEFGPYAHTNGNNYQETLENALQVLELLVEDYIARGKELPKYFSQELNKNTAILSR